MYRVASKVRCDGPDEQEPSAISRESIFRISPLHDAAPGIDREQETKAGYRYCEAYGFNVNKNT